MPLVPAKCPQCGGALEVDNTQDAAICPHCHMPFVSEKAITNYNTYQQSNYTIANANIQMNDEKSVENRLKNAEVFLTKLQDSQKARKIFEDVSDDAPDDYRGWWGMLRVDTREFTYVECGESYFNRVKELYTRAIGFAAPDTQAELQGTWSAYEKKVFSISAEKASERNNHAQTVENLNNEIAALNYDISKNMSLRDAQAEELRILLSKKAPVALYIIGGILMFTGIAIKAGNGSDGSTAGVLVIGILLVLLGILVVVLRSMKRKKLEAGLRDTAAKMNNAANSLAEKESQRNTLQQRISDITEGLR